ncbi:MAG TPA: xanthine dehydrogenase family protein subunit M [Candidatus Acidoferrum sp.]|nr:xanthine dehydrogenase family protein subunit M [Candidatus Acidoferrum sp.]
MRGFAYVQADSAESARELVRDDPQARFYAGGTTLVDLMKGGVEVPSRIVDISRLPLSGIESRGDHLRIGALARNSDVAYDSTVAAQFPALAQALLSGASGQLRNAATVGGNLLQRTRCPYFRETRWRCNKREPGSGCDALDGFNRAHALLGTSEDCIAAYPGDMAVALAALSANVVIEGTTGERVIGLDEFYVLPAADPRRETTLAHGELVVGVEVRFAPLHARSRYVKVRDRASYEFALVSVACAVELDGGRIGAARLALGGIATVPWRARKAEDALIGMTPSDEVFARAAEIALERAVPRRYNRFKLDLAHRTIMRALRETCEETR